MKAETVLILAGVGAAAVAVWWLANPQRMQDAAAGSVALAGAVGSGVVLGVGDAVGIPRTDQTECDKAIAEGRRWDASFACPASTFIKSIFN